MRRVFLALIGLAISIVAVSAGSQTLMQPTPAPAATAESEPWFVSREPIVLGGVLYYPAGPQVHFNRDEMVPSGFYGRVPIYIQTTLEPRSVVFVPLSGGLMQPYERRRAGELAGTVGSRPPSFPVENPAESIGTTPGMLQAPGPPIRGGGVGLGSPVPTSGTPSSGAPSSSPPPRPVPTTGTNEAVRRHPLASASRPEGLNGIFINYADRRWFSSGEAVPLDDSFTRIGAYGNLPVYSRRGVPETVFVPVSEGASALVAPYASTRVR